MYKLHLLQHPDWHRTGTSYCYFHIVEIIHQHSVISKINPSFFTIKEGVFSKTYPSFLTVKEGSTFLSKPLFPQGREDVTALWCSEPLRYKVGGASKPSPYYAGWDRQRNTSIYMKESCIQSSFYIIAIP